MWLVFVLSACSGASSDDGTPSGLRGMVGVTQSTDWAGKNAAPRQYGLGAFFSSTPSTTTCSSSKSGDCVTVNCVGGVPPDLPPYPSAGAITLTGGAKIVTLSPESDGTYHAVSALGELWQGGETLSFQAGGADVPSFSVDLVAPAALVVLAPDFPDQPNRIDVDPSLPLDVAWDSASQQGVVSVSMSVTDDTDRTTAVECDFDVTRKSAVIPAAALATLIKGFLGSIDVELVESREVRAGKWSVAVRAIALGASQESIPSATFAVK